MNATDKHALVEKQQKESGLEKAHLEYELVTGNGDDQISSIGDSPKVDANPTGRGY